MSGQRRSVPPAGAGRAINSISRPAWAATRRGEIGDGDLFGRADMIDAEMLALCPHHHARRATRSSTWQKLRVWLAVALDLERQLAGGVLRGDAL